MASACFNLTSQDTSSYPSILGVSANNLSAYNGQTVQVEVPEGNTARCYLVEYVGNCPPNTPVTKVLVLPEPCSLGEYCGCPEGYTATTGNQECVKTFDVPATYNGSSYDVVKASFDPAYGSLGTIFYEDITSKLLPISASSSPLGLRDATLAPVLVTNLVTTGVWGFASGRLNYSSVWTGLTGPFPCENPPCNEWIGFSTCLEVVEAGTYCIGLAADNRTRLRINGQLWVQFDILNAYNFNRWHVLPVTLAAGINVIEVEGYNDGQNAAFGVEIYKATVAELLPLANLSELSPFIVFSTRDQIGVIPFNTGTDSGYSCPPGYALNLCGDSPVCSIIDRAPYVPCSYRLSNCTTSALMAVNTDLSTYIGKVVTLENIQGCWSVLEVINEVSLTEVVVLEEFDTCPLCTEKCYLLVECNNLLPSIKTDVDLSTQVGKFIKLGSCPNNCWEVFEADDCDGEIITVNLANSFQFDTCEDCNPPIILPTPEVIHSRKVKPGYNTPGCSPEYTEKINCNFADQVYNKMVQVRYGITPCCENEYDKYLLKKEILDLQAIYDENGCRSTCFTCKPPCGVETSMRIYAPIYCLAPESVDAVLTLIVGPCGAPTGVTSSTVKTFRGRGQ